MVRRIEAGESAEEEEEKEAGLEEFEKRFAEATGDRRPSTSELQLADFARRVAGWRRAALLEAKEGEPPLEGDRTKQRKTSASVSILLE